MKGMVMKGMVMKIMVMMVSGNMELLEELKCCELVLANLKDET
jgi:hypothetical protein